MGLICLPDIQMPDTSIAGHHLPDTTFTRQLHLTHNTFAGQYILHIFTVLNISTFKILNFA